MTWSLPATAATVTSLSRAGTGAFMVQVPCGVPCGVTCAWATDAHTPTAAQTPASVITLRARSLIVHSRSFRIQGASRLTQLAANHFSETLVRSAVAMFSPAEPCVQPAASYPSLQLAQRDVP